MSPRPGFVLDVDSSTPPTLFWHGERFSLEKLPEGSRVDLRPRADRPAERPPGRHPPRPHPSRGRPGAPAGPAARRA